MCGIAGIFGQSDEHLARQFCRVLEHRGPDDEGFLTSASGPITLASRRLAILDLSPAGHQPMQTAGGRCTLVYNGEVYNFAEIRSELQSRGRQFRSRGDTEVVLEALAEKGTAALGEFNGMFALAFWNARERKGLLARDPFGVKPLYYAPLPGGRLIFASEIKALLLHPELAAGLNLCALPQYLAFLWTPDPATLFEGIYKLPPGHLLEWQEGAFSIRRYYELPALACREEVSEEGAVEGLRLHLRRAVQRQRVSDVPVGLFLSGGLDSSALLAEMAGASPLGPAARQEIRCYTAGFPAEDNAFDQFGSDPPYARAVARRFGAHLREFEIRAGMTDLLPKLLYHLDEPLADPAVINTYLICKQAREDGARVLLSGQGADELLGGYRRHIAPLLNERLQGAPAALLGAVARLSKRLPAGLAGRAGGALRRARKLLEPVNRPPSEQFVHYCQWLHDDDVRSLLAPEVLATLGLWRHPSAFTEEVLGQSPSGGLLDRMLYRDLKTFLPALNLTYTDKMSMAASVEARVPYLDLELAEFCWRLPQRYKVRGATGKWLLRRAMRGTLPAEVLWRSKTGFGAPVRQWMRHELKEMAADLLSPAALRAGGVFCAEGVEALRASFADGQGDHGYTLWALLVFQLWREVFLRQPAAR
ncbi:MAG TPA: asparagine synthase (glutamine-hydrolyzing) [Bryobacterales bacterium]|nr:asparagine synthase (glutamine-hydrolyzing) [Bryobacterales bacterium]